MRGVSSASLGAVDKEQGIGRGGKENGGGI